MGPDPVPVPEEALLTDTCTCPLKSMGESKDKRAAAMRPFASLLWTLVTIPYIEGEFCRQRIHTGPSVYRWRQAAARQRYLLVCAIDRQLSRAPRVTQRYQLLRVTNGPLTGRRVGTPLTHPTCSGLRPLHRRRRRCSP